ncbi:uncharacterized protein LOC132296908 [Cornus florida]|uniref:uncharacterized protein LOC132296908 n=1 Tax=Cornus florida TaxID=4283 RepID=UPI0028973B91|nr:uncharacterized protein LOC132296908 [Cornus florida]
MGFTENNSLTYLSTSNPCLDLFFHVVPDTDSDCLTGMLKKSWDFNSLTTLKLVCNLRGVRGTGKSDKKNFYRAALWLHQHHPKTLASNVGVLAEFGYFKDLPEILFRLLEGPEARSIAMSEWKMMKGRKGKGESRKERKERRINSNMEKLNLNDPGEKARILRKERAVVKAQKAFGRYTRDPQYQFLHDKISDLFAERLRSDIHCLKTGMMNKISLAGKWCPSIDSSYDKSTLICESIAIRVFPREDYEEYREIEEAHYVYRVRDRLRKEVLVPLRKALELPEVYMCAKQWNTLPYNRVASVAMKKYKKAFLQRDNERFAGYLEDVKIGKAKISAGALLPHEIIASLSDEDGGKVAELQWARMVEDLAGKGKLRNCIAVCDVSGSMNGTPMEVCVALGLLISELSEDPWKGKVITFSANPQLHEVEGDSLLEKTSFVKRMGWGGNTDFQKVFDRILKIAVDGKLSEEQMIKKIFVFSDMEFDEASRKVTSYSESDSNSEDAENDSETDDEEAYGYGLRWETDYEVIQRKFQENGYSKVPEIVFWNLRHSSATPVTAKQSGVALVSGFSKNMVTMFLEEDGIVNPEFIMEKAISGELYQKLAVYD